MKLHRTATTLALGVATLMVALIQPLEAAPTDTVLQAQQKRVQVLKTISPAVVAIFGDGGNGGGSGVLITPDGYALSNFHVTSGAGDFMKCGLNDGVLYDAVIVGIDPTGDVALIKMLGRDDFPYATMGDSDTVQVGDWAYAIGNPFLLATDFSPTVTYGIVSGVHRYQYPAGTFLEYADCIQVDSSINPGNSGGPLFNDAGELIGINGRGSFEKRGRVNSGAGYAISINQIGHFIDHLRSGRIVDHATLGAAVVTDEEGRVVVSSILESSEAWRRGLRLDDEIVSFAGRPIRTVNQFKNVLGIYPSGWRLPLSYRRDGQRFDIFARLQSVHTRAELLPPGMSPQPQRPEQPDGDPQNPHAEQQDKVEPPEAYKHMFVKKAGYTNYWFNEQEQKRLLPIIERWGDYSKFDGTWKLVGKAGSGDTFTLTLAEKGLGLELGTEPYFQALDGSDLADEPSGSGGLLFAMHQLRLMLTQRQKGFSEYYYLGSEPLDVSGELVDVILTTVNGVQTRWFFSRESAELVGFSSQLYEDSEECEVYFPALEQSADRVFPRQIVVRSGGLEFLRLNIDAVDFGTREAE